MKNLISVFLSIFFLSSTYYSFFVFEQKVNKALEIQLSIKELKRDQSLFSEEIARNMSLIGESLKKVQDSDLELITSTQYSDYACAAMACIFVIFATCLVSSFFAYSAYNIDPVYSAVFGSTKKALINRNEYENFVLTYAEKIKTLCDTSLNNVTGYHITTFIPNYEERVLIIGENLRICSLKIAELETKLDFILLDPSILGSNLEETAKALSQLTDIISP